MKKQIVFALIITFVLSLVGCGGAGGAATSEVDDLQAVKNQLDQWSDHINDRDGEKVMEGYSKEYLHDGITYEDEELGWAFLFALEDRIIIKFEDVHYPSISIIGSQAEVIMHYNLVISILEDGVWTDELSKEEFHLFLRKKNGKWLLYGNQESDTRNKDKSIWKR